MTDIKHVHELREGVQYAIVGDNNSVFRNDQQVVMGMGDTSIDLLCELHDFLDAYLPTRKQGETQTVMDVIEDKHPENLVTKDVLMRDWEADPPNATDDFVPLNDLDWEGFTVRGGIHEDDPQATVTSHVFPSQWATLTLEAANMLLAQGEDYFDMLMAQAFKAWYRENMPPLDAWPEGTTLKVKGTEHYAYVWSFPVTGKLVLTCTDGSVAFLDTMTQAEVEGYEVI